MMRRSLLLLSALFAPLAALGQNPLPGTVSTTPTTPEAVGAGYPYGYIVSTPTAGFAAPPTTAGISEAGRAGISEVAPANNFNPPPIEPVVQESRGAPSGTPGPIPETAVQAPVAPVNSSSSAESLPGREQQPSNDLGPSFYGSPVNGGSAETLGEVAARYGKKRLDLRGHVFTNADIENLRTGGAADSVQPASPEAAPAGSQIPQPENPPSQNLSPLGTANPPPGDGGAQQNGQAADHQKPSPGTAAPPKFR